MKTRSSGSLRARILFLRVAILVGVLGIWQAAGSETIRLSLPTFTRVLTAIGDMLSDGSLIEGLLITNQAMVAGFALALLIGLPLGIAMGSRASVERLAQPYLTILLAMPMIAVTPIVQGVFGLSFTARVVIVFLFSFIYVVVNAAVGVQGVAAELREMGRSFGASRAQTLRQIVLPGALPAIMAGVRLALGRAMIGMVVAELSLIGAGIGSLILEYETRFESAYVFGIVLVVVLEGVLLMEIARRVEARAGRWRGTGGT